MQPITIMVSTGSNNIAEQCPAAYQTSPSFHHNRTLNDIPHYRNSLASHQSLTTGPQTTWNTKPGAWSMPQSHTSEAASGHQSHLELAPCLHSVLAVELFEMLQHRLRITELWLAHTAHVRLLLACGDETSQWLGNDLAEHNNNTMKLLKWYAET